MANVVEVAVILVCPYISVLVITLDLSVSQQNAERTVENCLAQGHDGRTKANQDGSGARPSAHSTLLVALLEDHPQVGQVHGGLDGVEEALGAGEAVAPVEGDPAVDVVDLAVQLVGHPERPVQGAALHGERAAEDVDGVPYDQREGDGHPGEDGVGGGVAPCC